MPFVVQKRLMGKEDINFDLNGTNETYTVTDSQGNVLNLTKLNASQLPILVALRAKFNAAENVETALDELVHGLNAIGSATLTEEGLIEIADSSEVAAGTDANKAVTPAGLFSATPSETQRAIVRAATQAEVEDGTSNSTMITPSNSQFLSGIGGRLVKFLTTSGTLTINDLADDSVASYLTSNEIKSGTYLVYCYGGGGGGGGSYIASTASTGSGGGEGGISRSVLTINSSTPYTIGAGGAGGAYNNDGIDGGTTTISSVVATGGIKGRLGNAAGGDGGSGTFANGQAGCSALVFPTGGPTGSVSGGGRYGGKGANASPIEAAGNGILGSGGGSACAVLPSGTGSGGGHGGDGYILIYEWEA